MPKFEILNVDSHSSTRVNVSQSDIRAIVRAELKSLKRDLQNRRPRDTMSRIHTDDLVERIDLILDPK